jgi:hypothetical protein
MNEKLITLLSFVAMLLFVSLFIVGFIFFGVTNESGKGAFTLVLALFAFLLWMFLLLFSFWAKQQSFTELAEEKKRSFRTKSYLYYVAITLPALALGFIPFLIDGAFVLVNILRGAYILLYFIIVFLLWKKSAWAWILALLNSAYLLSYSWSFLEQGILGLLALILAVFLFVFSAANIFLDFARKASTKIDYWLGSACLLVTALYGCAVPVILIIQQGLDTISTNSYMLSFIKLLFVLGLAAFVLGWQLKKSNTEEITVQPPDEW